MHAQPCLTYTTGKFDTERKKTNAPGGGGKELAAEKQAGQPFCPQDIFRPPQERRVLGLERTAWSMVIGMTEASK